MNEITFLQQRKPEPIRLERPIDEHEVYQLWWRAGVIQRMGSRPWRLSESIVGIFALGAAVGFAFGYFTAFRP